MRSRHKTKSALALIILVAAASPAVAGLIYTWQADDGLATGTIEFADGVEFYDNPEDVLSFLFVTPESRSFDESFAFEALNSVIVGGDTLCYVLCDGKRVTKKKVKRKKSKEGVNEEPDFARAQAGDTSYLRWLFTAYEFEGTEINILSEETGFGRWALVRVPEPSTLLLLFGALGLLGTARRRLFKG